MTAGFAVAVPALAVTLAARTLPILAEAIRLAVSAVPGLPERATAACLTLMHRELRDRSGRRLAAFGAWQRRSYQRAMRQPSIDRTFGVVCNGRRLVLPGGGLRQWRLVAILSTAVGQ